MRKARHPGREKVEQEERENPRTQAGRDPRRKCKLCCGYGEQAFPPCRRFPPQHPPLWVQLRVYQASSYSCISETIVAASIKSITFLIVPESLKVRMTIAHKCQGTVLSPPGCRASRQSRWVPACVAWPVRQLACTTVHIHPVTWCRRS